MYDVAVFFFTGRKYLVCTAHMWVLDTKELVDSLASFPGLPRFYLSFTIIHASGGPPGVHLTSFT